MHKRLYGEVGNISPASIMEYATKDQIREFYAEFGATEETVRRDVQYLAEWLKKQPHLPSIEGELDISTIF